MTDIRHLLNGVPPGMAAVPMQRAPTEAELAEVHTVRAMQARDRAVALAVEYLRSDRVVTSALLELARRIALYIETGGTDI